MTESAVEILPRMLRDRWRVEAGERRLDELLRAGQLAGRVAALLLDIDGSGAVRSRGIAAKIRLVEQVQRLVAGLVPAGAVVIDSGTRDEMYVVLPVAGAPEILALGERIRSAVAARAFPIDGPSDTVRVTVSVGCVALAAAGSGGEILDRAGDALYQAKRIRDCVVLADPPAARHQLIPVPRRLLDTLAARDADPAAVLRTGLSALQEKHGPVWHWVVERGGAAPGELPELPYALTTADAPAGARAFFELLVWSTALEAALGHRPRPVSVVRGARAPGGFAARYLPGEWVICRTDGAGTPVDPARVFASVQAARDGGDEGLIGIEIALGARVTAMLDRVSGLRCRSVPALVAEALHLGLDALRAWEPADRVDP